MDIAASPNEAFVLNQTATAVELIWWRLGSYTGKMSTTGVGEMTIESSIGASIGSGDLIVNAAKLQTDIIECDYLRPKTNAASDVIDIYGAGGTTVQNNIYTDNGGGDAGFVAGTNAAFRGFFAAYAHTSGTAEAGIFLLQNESGSNYYLWVDTSGNLRGHTSDPGSNDTLGVVIADLDP